MTGAARGRDSDRPAAGARDRGERTCKARPLQAGSRWFFPLAAVYGIVAVPASVHGMLSATPVLPGFASSVAHAHELLFGYALAVVAGFMVTRATPRWLLALLIAWVAGRVAFLLQPQSVIAIGANILFATMLAIDLVPKFLGRARKWRNQAFGVLFLAISVAAVSYHAGTVGGWQVASRVAVEVGVLLFALLLLFMGGRVIAPALAGALVRAGVHMEARVQPRLEGALLVVMAGAIIAALGSASGTVAGSALLVAGVLAGVRLLRWRPWLLRHHPDLLCLLAGYLWIVVGLWVLGWHWVAFGQLDRGGLHAITVGALGTLTLTVMTRTHLLKDKRDPASERCLPLAAGLMSIAAVLRTFAAPAPMVLGMASIAWSLALALVLPTLLRGVPIRSRKA